MWSYLFRPSTMSKWCWKSSICAAKFCGRNNPHMDPWMTKLDLLEVYLQWYMHRQTEYAHLAEDENSTVELNDIVHYWEQVAKGDPQRNRIALLAWPNCKLEITCLEAPIERLIGKYPHFAGRIIARQPREPRDDGYYSSRDRGSSLTDMDFQSLYESMPHASALTLHDYEPLRINLAFKSLKQVDKLRLVSPRQLADLEFQQFSRLSSLELSGGGLDSITDSAFQHLHRLREFKIDLFRGMAITDAAFQYLSNLSFLHLSGVTDGVTDRAFEGLSGLGELYLMDCHHDKITNAAFQHLGKLTSLGLCSCEEAAITNAIFSNLKELRFLSIRGTRHLRVPCSTLEYLKSLRSLNIDYSSFSKGDTFQHLSALEELHVCGIYQNPKITNRAMIFLSALTSLVLTDCDLSLLSETAFRHASTWKYLDLSRCSNLARSDEVFQRFQGLSSLVLWELDGDFITDAGIQNLAGLEDLTIVDCLQETLTNDAFQHLSSLRRLSLSNCSHEALGDLAFRHLSQLTLLQLEMCNRSTLTEGAFRFLSNLRWLENRHCSQSTITDRAFQHLLQLSSLTINHCTQTQLSDAAFTHLTNLKELDIVGCPQTSITDRMFVHLSTLESLFISECDQLTGTLSEYGLSHLANLRKCHLFGRESVTKESTRISRSLSTLLQIA
eukprot:gb/GECG01008836.1/.p1 GENE.gb/GECG01008836.1/~~gb/GECG01008836.1/.p1  ORF type:complete len:668 (+),score=48.05 gb/GECG01008836.1/:1-2004(+)